jgi:hypothetical protein
MRPELKAGDRVAMSDHGRKFFTHHGSVLGTVLGFTKSDLFFPVDVLWDNDEDTTPHSPDDLDVVP